MADNSTFVVKAWVQEDNRWLWSSSPAGPWKGPFPVGELTGVAPSEAEEVRQVLLRRANQLDERRYRIQLSTATGVGLRVARSEFATTLDRHRLAGLAGLCAEVQAQMLKDVNESPPVNLQEVPVDSGDTACRETDGGWHRSGDRNPLASQVALTAGLRTLDASWDPDRQRKQRQLDLWNAGGRSWQEIAALILKETRIDSSAGALRMETTRFAAETGQPIRTGKPGAKKRTVLHEKNV